LFDLSGSDVGRNEEKKINDGILLKNSDVKIKERKESKRKSVANILKRISNNKRVRIVSILQWKQGRQIDSTWS
jgi:hypothetical protein